MKTGQKLAMLLGLVNIPGSASLIARSENQEPEDYFGYPRKQRDGEYGAWQVKMADMEASSALSGLMHTLESFKKVVPTPKPAEESPAAEEEAPDPLDAFLARRAAERSSQEAKDDAAEKPTTNNQAAEEKEQQKKAAEEKDKEQQRKAAAEEKEKEQQKKAAAERKEQQKKAAEEKEKEQQRASMPKPDAAKASVKVEVVKSKTIEQKEIISKSKKDQAKDARKKESKEILSKSKKDQVKDTPKKESKDAAPKPDAAKTKVKVEVVKSKAIEGKEAKKEDKKDKEDTKDKETKKDKGKDGKQDKNGKKDKEDKKDLEDKKVKEAKKGNDGKKDKEATKGESDKKDKEIKKGKEDKKDKEAKKGNDDKKDKGIKKGKDDKAAKKGEEDKKVKEDKKGKGDKEHRSNSKKDQAKAVQFLLVEGNLEAGGMSHSAAEAEATAIVSSWHKKDKDADLEVVSVLSGGAKSEFSKKEGTQIVVIEENLEASGMSHKEAEAEATATVRGWRKKNKDAELDVVSVLSGGAKGEFSKQEGKNIVGIEENLEASGMSHKQAEAEATATVRGWRKKAHDDASPIDESLRKNIVSVMSAGAGAQHFTAEQERFKESILENIEKDGMDPIAANAEADAIVWKQMSSPPALRGAAPEQKQQDKKIMTLAQTSAKVTFAEEDADSQNEEQALEAESEQLRKEISDAKTTLAQLERELA